ncbi:MAG: hypothetical protein ACNA8K_16010 [Cyclonatronaceae bacterium]
MLYAKQNLVAWCIVPFDSENRNPAARAELLNELGFTRMALYNHGDWFGEPENQIRIIEATGADDIGLVYNFHHGHHQIENFPVMVEMMLPWLWTVNLNGMRQEGPKIMDIGKGDHEAGMMRILRESGFKGTIGIIGHTEGEDVRKPLMRNLDGLKQILEEMGDTEALATYR